MHKLPLFFKTIKSPFTIHTGLKGYSNSELEAHHPQGVKTRKSLQSHG
jgi:hypothetical protein